MSARILLACYEVPGYGGASTASYRLFEQMQRDGLDVQYLNLIDEEDACYFRYRFGDAVGNPRGLENVSNCILTETLFAPHPALADTVEAIDPAVIVADDYIATLLMKRAAPERRVIFMTAGMAQVVAYLARRRARGRFTIDELLTAARGGLTVFHAREREAMEVADLIVTHSDLIDELTRALFPLQQGKVYSRIIWRAEWITADAVPYAALGRPFSERDIDVIFAASSWARPEKNGALMRRIVSRCRGLNVHVVGELERAPRGAHCHGLLTDREALFALLGRSRVLVSPSRFDPAPGILWEASVMGCNVVASLACGNWRLCHTSLLAEPDQLDDYMRKIGVAVEAELPDNMRFFLESGSYRDLVETIETVASMGSSR